MQNVVLIGLGVISDKYRNGLTESANFNLVGICDLDETKLNENKFDPNIAKFLDYKDIAKHKEELKINSVIIATPPEKHFEMARFFLENGIDVIIEKPATTTFEDLKKLYQIAKENNTKFNVMFHWNFGSEIVYLSQAIDDYQKKYGRIKKIEVLVFDPYCDETQKHIKPEKVQLAGTWLDCGINCLSMVGCIEKVKDIKPVDLSYKIDEKSGYTYFTDYNFLLNNSIDLRISVDWREQKNFKRTYIYFENGEVMFVDHQDQIIFVAKNDEEKQKLKVLAEKLEQFHDANHIFRPDFLKDYLVPECDFDTLTKEDRLHTHYYNLFTQRNIKIENGYAVECSKSLKDIEESLKIMFDIDDILNIHQILFKYDAKNQTDSKECVNN